MQSTPIRSDPNKPVSSHKRQMHLNHTGTEIHPRRETRDKMLDEIANRPSGPGRAQRAARTRTVSRHTPRATGKTVGALRAPEDATQVTTGGLVGQVVSTAVDSRQSFELLVKVLGNVLANPGNPKFREVRKARASQTQVCSIRVLKCTDPSARDMV